MNQERPKSYIVTRALLNKEELIVKESHFAPGYTKAHKATPIEAVDYEIGRQRIIEDTARNSAVKLYRLRGLVLRESQVED